MWQTIYTIPESVYGAPLFGFGVLLGLWAIVAVATLTWSTKKHGLGKETLSYLPLLLTLGAVIALAPKFFSGGVPIRGYGVMLLLAATAAVGLSVHRARQVGVPSEIIIALAFWLFVIGIAGARLFHVIEYWNTQYNHWDAAKPMASILATLKAVINVPQGGLVVYGSLIGAAAAFVWFVRGQKLPLLAMADLIAPSLVLGLAIGRIGCLLNGCCFGGYCELPWAITFPPEAPPYQDQLVRGGLYGMLIDATADGPAEIGVVAPGSVAAQAGLKTGQRIVRLNGIPVANVGQAEGVFNELLRDGPALIVQTADDREVSLAAPGVRARSLPVHPTQIYSAINAALLCIFVWAYYPFRRHDGQVIALLFTLYPVTRFLLETIRVDEPAVFHTGLSISQNVSLLVLAAVVPLWWYVLRQPLAPLVSGAVVSVPEANAAVVPASRPH